jgi:sugar (pentulose or hexulose) kinase
MYLGIDFGTSGARGVIIDDDRQVILSVNTSFQPYPPVHLWEKALHELFSQIPSPIASQLKSIVLDATSSTVVLCDRTGNPLDEAIWYNDDRGKEYLSEIRAFAPENHLVISATSSLAKLHWWYHQPIFSQSSYFLHQSDWLAFLLHGKLGISDYHYLRLSLMVESSIVLSYFTPHKSTSGENCAYIFQN